MMVSRFICDHDGAVRAGLSEGDESSLTLADRSTTVRAQVWSIIDVPTAPGHLIVELIVDESGLTAEQIAAIPERGPGVAR